MAMTSDPAFEAQVNRRLRLGLRDRWYCIATSWEIGDKPVAMTRLGEKLVLWRDESGTVHVQEDYCPHRGAAFSLGFVTQGKITCAYHGVQADGDGVVTAVPALPDCHMVGQKLVRTYPSFEQYQGIFAYFGSDPEAAPPPYELPIELTSPDWAGVLHAGNWGGNHMYVWENLADPMHAPYLHGNSFTLASGTRSDMIKLRDTDQGFEVFREGQKGVNFDWAEVVRTSGMYVRVAIPYPPAGGPGGILRILCYVTPIDEDNARIFFWRMRQSSGWQRDMWRLLYRTRLVHLADQVLEQDRLAVESMPKWPARENLYQHDNGLVRLRRQMRRDAESQIRREVETHEREPVGA